MISSSLTESEYLLIHDIKYAKLLNSIKYLDQKPSSSINLNDSLNQFWGSIILKFALH